MSQFWIEQGDAAEALKLIPSGSVDALVTDPPAGISFMDKEWDGAKGGRDKWVVRHRAEAQVPDGPLTPYALAMPEKHQIVDALYLVELPAHTVLDSGVAAYRAYYRNEKRGYRFTDKWVVPAKWTRRQPPEWF